MEEAIQSFQKTVYLVGQQKNSDQIRAELEAKNYLPVYDVINSSTDNDNSHNQNSTIVEIIFDYFGRINNRG